MRYLIALAALALASPAAAQILNPTALPADVARTSAVAAAQAAADAAAASATNAATTANAAYAKANAPVVTPTTFSGTTCAGCTMTNPTFTGTPTINGNAIVTSPTPATAQGLAYFHRYANVTLTMPAIGIGGTGTGTASVPGTAVGDQCFVAPTSTTTLLNYVMASGWVTTAGTVRVSLAATSLVAISAGTIVVNMLCAQ